MIRIECDNCEKPFEVDPGEAGGKVPCPDCGDINRVPRSDAAQSDAPQSRSPQSRGPRNDLPPEDGPEQDILMVRPTMFRSRPMLYSLILLLALGGLVGAIYGGTREQQWLIWIGGILGITGLVWWFGWYVFHLGQRVRITNKRTIYGRGLLSRHTSEVLHNHIRNLQIKQNLWQRMTNVGDMVLDSSAGGGGSDVGAEIRVRNVPRPQELKRIIDQYRAF